MILNLIPMIIAAIAIYHAVSLYIRANKKRKVIQEKTRDYVQLLFTSRLAYGTGTVAFCYILLSIHWMILDEKVVPEMTDLAWNALESLMFGFLAQACRWARDNVLARLDSVAIERHNAELARLNALLDKKQKQTEAENDILQMIAAGCPFFEVAQSISEHTESFDPDIRCSILINRNDKLYDFWSPSLSQSYKDLMRDGFPFGPGNGACGAAAYYQDFFFVDDIETHENWTPFPVFQDEVRAMGIKAVWSSAILDSRNRVLGTVAFYSADKRMPEPKCVSLLNWASYIAGIAIERRNMIDALRSSEEMVRGIVDSQHELLIRADIDGTVRFINRTYKDTFGLTDKMVQDGFDFKCLIHPDDLADSIEHHEKALRPPCRTRHRQRCWTTNEEYRTFEWEAWGILDASGKPIGIAGCGRDVSEQQIAEDYRDALLKAIPDIVFVHDAEGFYHDCYANNEDSLSAPCPNVIGKNIADFIDPCTVEECLYKFPRILRTKIPDVIEYQMVICGRVKYFEARIVPLIEDKLLSVVRDVTDWKKAQTNLAAQLVAQQKALRVCRESELCPGSEDGSCQKAKRIK